MEDLNWLADLASDCYDFGETHGNERVKFRANEVFEAMERDFGLKFKLLPRRSTSIEITPNGYTKISENVIRFPLRGCKDANRNEDQKERFPLG